MKHARRLLVLGLVASISACMNRPLVEVDPVVESYVKHEMTQVQFSGVDILVLVDNSMSMTEEQANLASNFPLLVQSLLDPGDSDGDTVPDHVPVKDLHIGVVSSDMGTGGYSVETCRDPIDGDNGELLHQPSSSFPPGTCDSAYANYLSYGCTDPACPDDAAIAWISAGFGCIATLGIDGCGFEQQLKAVRKALIDNRDLPSNSGFLRDSSILTVLIVTDEEDCSIAPGNERIFDTLDSSLGHLNLRCFNHPYMVQDINTYIADFDSLRADPEKLVLAFIVGVPQDPVCEGFGDGIPNCLTHPDMQEAVDPLNPTRLVPSCATSNGEAYPPRRFVTMAQQFGNRALVHSVCDSDFRPAIEGLTEKLHDVVDQVSIVRELETTNATDADGDTVPDNTCRCLAVCEIIESLSDLRSCDTVGKPCYEPAGPGTGCAPAEVDPDGLQHTLCEIPQAGTRMSPCPPEPANGCNTVGVTHAIDGTGWYYMGRNWVDSLGTTYTEPQILFTEGMEPEEGSNVYIQCESFICPQTRQCGPASNPTSICCEWNEYCDRSGTELRCVPRPE